MDNDGANFENWFKKPILKLQKDPEAGLILVILSIALLERYLRETSGLSERTGVDDQFLNELSNEFSVLRNDDLALKFWSVCRNGLMHQVTFRAKWGGNHVTIGLHEDAPVIDHRKDGSDDIFIISPIKFSNRVIGIIESNFAAFKAPTSPNHPLSDVHSIFGYSGYSGIKP